MIDQYVLATNDDGDLAVRTVQATESSSVTDTTSVITATDDGKLAVRVVGGGGGDSHNKGYYATQSALETAYPTAEAGDYAIVGSTDTVWIWDTDTSAWVDTDTKGEVVSVNGKTGTVVLNANDVGAVPQVSELPTASASNLGNIVQYVGATTEDYTNGYFYKCATNDSGVGSGEIDVTYWYPDPFTPPVTGSVDIDVLSQYLEQNGLQPITDGRIEIVFQPNDNNIIFEYNFDTGGVSTNIPWNTVTTQAAEDIFANMGFDFDFSGVPTNMETVTGGQMPSATVYFWKSQPVMDSIGVYKDSSELPEATEENVGTAYLVTPYDSETLSAYSPEMYMSVPYILNYIDGEAEVTDYYLTPETQPTDVMIDWATLESFLNSQETGFDWTNDSINISLNGENLDVLYNADFSDSAVVQTDGTVANIQQALENIGITVDLTGYTQFHYFVLKLPTEIGYENRQIPAFVPTSGTAEIDYVLKADGNGGAYWGSISALQNTATGNQSFTVGGTPTNANYSMNIGLNSSVSGDYSLAIGRYATVTDNNSVVIGGGTAQGRYDVVLGNGNIASGRNGSIVIGNSQNITPVEESNVAVFTLNEQNYKILDSDGSIPTDRLAKNSIQHYTIMPAASPDLSGVIAQYVGATDGSYTNGYFYKCSQGTSSATASQTTGSSLSDVAVVVATFETQATDSGSYVFTYSAADSAWIHDYLIVNLVDWGISYTGTPVDGDVITVVYDNGLGWTQTDVQPGGGIQNTATGPNSLTILGTASAYSNCVNIGNQSEASAGSCVAIGEEAQAYNNDGSVVVGYNSRAWGGYGVAIGWQAESGASMAIQLGNGSNSDANTFKVANANGNFEIMDANGNMPADRLASTTGLADGNYRLRLTMASGVPTLTWVAE